MADRRTTFACPEHEFCVVVFISCPHDQAGERKPLTLPHEYEPWVRKINEAIVQVEHHEAPATPDGLLVGEVIVAPKDIGNRMKMAERNLVKHAMSLNDADVLMHEVKGEAMLRDAGLERRIGASEDAWSLAAYDLQAEISSLVGEVEELRDFVTRRRGWRRAWAKRQEPDDE